MLFDREERRLKTGAPDHLFMKRWEPVSGRVWRMHPAEGQRGKLRAMEPGDPFVYMARSGGAVVFFHGCADCMVEGVTIHASPIRVGKCFGRCAGSATTVAATASTSG